jgi:hypothetical protein
VIGHERTVLALARASVERAKPDQFRKVVLLG